MAYIFSLVEQAQITAAATQGPAPGQPGNFVAMYSKVRDIVSSHISDGTIAGTDKSSAVNVLNWLNGKGVASAGIGVNLRVHGDFVTRKYLGFDLNRTTLSGEARIAEDSYIARMRTATPQSYRPAR